MFTMAEMVNEQKTSPAAECDRLRELYDQGHLDEVLARVDEYRATLATTEETVVDSNNHEALLNVAVAAAHGLGRWPEALELNAELQRSQADRGAGEEERAVTRINDYGPLLRLGQGKDALDLLYGCRTVFAQAENIAMMGDTLSALADAKAHLGGADGAVREETDALRLKYRGSDPEAIAVSHHNLANYLFTAEEDLLSVWAHHLAATLIRYRTGSLRLAASIEAIGRLVALQTSPEAPLSFDDVCTLVDGVSETHFTALFDQLSDAPGTGQAALDEVMRLTTEARDTAMRESVAAWEPIISAMVVAAGPDAPPEVASVLDEAFAELRNQHAWQELVAVLTRIKAGPYYHSEETLRFLDPVSDTVARRARAALAGEVIVDPTAWRMLTEEA